MLEFSKIEGFDWDDGNARKSEDRHAVAQGEIEQVFFNSPLVVTPDSKHSQSESRFHALGRTDGGRLLHVKFTLRFGETKIRPISARDMHRKERRIYEDNTQKDS